VRVGPPQEAARCRRRSRSTELLNRAAKAFAKPGFDRRVIFGSGRNRKVFAYSVYPNDPSKIIRKLPTARERSAGWFRGKFRLSKAA